MRDPLTDPIFGILLRPQKAHVIVMTVVTVVLIPFTYFIVYITGGIQYVYSHTMYIAIVLAAFVYGVRGGLIAGIAGGLVLGPLMPIDVVTGQMQPMMNWVYRMLIFVMIGTLTGYFAKLTRKTTDQIVTLMSTHPVTGIPIYNQIYSDPKIVDQLQRTGSHILIFRVSNQEVLSDMFGFQTYSKMLEQAHHTLRERMPELRHVFQLDSNKLVILVPNENVERVQSDIERLFSDPMNIDGIYVHVDVAFGIAAIESDFKLAVEQAVIASRYAAHWHSSAIRYTDIRTKELPNLKLLGDFNKHLKEQHLYAVYQPIIDLRTDRTISFEVLTRWDHPEYGSLRPDVFIPLLEETTLINLLTTWVIDQTMHTVEQHPILKQYLFDINISTHNLSNPMFVDHLLKMIRSREEIQLEFEITERAMVDADTDIEPILRSLQRNDVAINIDDFGTKYSSLSYLSEYPIHKVKIDKYFMSELANHPRKQTIVKSIVELCHALNITVVAEGIEDRSSYDIAKHIGCDYAQGYFIAMPFRLEQLLAWVAVPSSSDSSS